jgi:hypothetical protein
MASAVKKKKKKKVRAPGNGKLIPPNFMICCINGMHCHYFLLHLYWLNFIYLYLFKKFLLYLQPRSNGIIIIKILELKILLECLWDHQEILTLTGEEGGCLCQWITWVHHFQVPCLTWVIHMVHLILLVGEFSHKTHLWLQDT